MAANIFSNQSNTALEASLTTTIPHYIREHEDELIAMRLYPALLQKRDRFKKNVKGTEVTWNVKRRLIDVTEGNGQRNFVEFTNRDNATLSWGAASCSMFISEQTARENDGNEAIYNISADIIDTIEESVQEWYADVLFADGVAKPGSGWMGLGTIFRTDGKIDITLPTLTKRVGDASDLFGYNNGTYAGINMLPGYEGGQSNAPAGESYPFALPDFIYQYWSPIILDYTSTKLGGATNDWKGQAENAITTASSYTCQYKVKDCAVTDVFMAIDLFNTFKEIQRTKERIIVDHGERVKEALELGFPDVMHYEGKLLSSDHKVPAGEAYGVNPNNIMVMCQGDRLVQIGEARFSDLPGHEPGLYQSAVVPGQKQIKRPNRCWALKPSSKI